jgi:ADP-ribosylation factor-binding protein GGA
LIVQGYELALEPQSGRNLLPKQAKGVTQRIVVWRAGDKSVKVESIKLRWRVAYKVNGELKSEMGEIPEFSIA